MSTFSLLGRMAQAKYATLTAHTVKPVRSPAPAGLHQGSAVEISAVPLILAQSGGAVFPGATFKTNQMVLSVGSYEQNGFTVYRAYLSDGVSFIEAPVLPTAPEVALSFRLYTLQTEFVVSTPDEREFFIGAEPVFESSVVAGPPTFNNPDGYVEQQVCTSERVSGIIGLSTFLLGAPESQVSFDRAWAPGTEDVVPQVVQETIRDATGGVTTATHHMMQYQRQAGDVVEYVYADYIEVPEGNVVNAHVGLPLDQYTLKILAST